MRVFIQNPGGDLKANMSANAEILPEEKHNILMFPEAAVIYDEERQTSVEVPDAKATSGRRKLSPTLGISNGMKTEVVAGLGEGDHAVLQ